MSDEDEESKADISRTKTATLGEIQEDNRPYKKVKHIFEIKVKELKNIPILDKLIKDISRNEQASNTSMIDRSTTKSKKQTSNSYI